MAKAITSISEIATKGTRTIVTVFYCGRRIVKVNLAVHPNKAVLHCVNHLQFNRYEATHAEIYDDVTGMVHAVFRRSIAGVIKGAIVFNNVQIISPKSSK